MSQRTFIEVETTNVWIGEVSRLKDYLENDCWKYEEYTKPYDKEEL